MIIFCQCPIKSIIYLNILFTLSNVIAQNENNNPDLLRFNDDNDPIIDPLELILNSTDSQGIFYCNSRTEINKQQNKLVASIDNTIATSPTFQLHTRQTNSTTIRIRIIPNGYIGINRISCHWDNNVTYGQTADLIIGEKPGVIQLKERCQAFDRRYVECIFRAPIISRAFRNGFPRLYNFSELNYEALSYHHPPSLVNITDENELVFHFRPRDRNTIPKKLPMSVNMTLSRFGSSIYLFNIEPVHTTKVDFQIENISSNKLTIRINHNNTGTISQRRCSGYVNHIDDKKIITAVEDIVETSDQKIIIEGLRLSSEYSICLRCYYEQEDLSSRQEICIPVNTTSKSYLKWLFITVVLIASSIIVPVGYVLYRRWHPTRPPVTVIGNIEDSPRSPFISPGYSDEPGATFSSIQTTSKKTPSIDSTSKSQATTGSGDGEVEDPSTEKTYMPMTSFLSNSKDDRVVAPDTIDLSRR